MQYNFVFSGLHLCHVSIQRVREWFYILLKLEFENQKLSQNVNDQSGRPSRSLQSQPSLR